MNPVSIRWGAWYEDRDMELWFPAGWDVTECRPHDGDDIGDAGIAASFAAPIGTPRLRDMARGRTSPCIVIDDLSRPTMGHRLIPPILAELAAAGIPPEDVLILAGIANHRPMTSEDLRKKIGDVVLSSCRLSSHFSWDNCVPVGTTSFGSPVEINREFMASDLRILVGSIIPHGATGFSGGGQAAHARHRQYRVGDGVSQRDGGARRLRGHRQRRPSRDGGSGPPGPRRLHRQLGSELAHGDRRPRRRRCRRCPPGGCRDRQTGVLHPHADRLRRGRLLALSEGHRVHAAHHRHEPVEDRSRADRRGGRHGGHRGHIQRGARLSLTLRPGNASGRQAPDTGPGAGSGLLRTRHVPRWAER